MTSQAISYENMSRVLLDATRGCQCGFESEIKNWAEDGPHMLYGIFTAKVLPALFAQESDRKDVLERIFGLYEEAATHLDERVRGVIGLSVCQELASNEVLLQKSQRYMGKETKKLCADVIS